MPMLQTLLALSSLQLDRYDCMLACCCLLMQANPTDLTIKDCSQVGYTLLYGSYGSYGS